MEPSFGDIVSSEMDESEPVPIQVPRDTSISSQHVSGDSNLQAHSTAYGRDRTQSVRTTGVETAVAYRVTSGVDPVPVLVIPNSSQNGSQSDWRAGAQVFDA